MHNGIHFIAGLPRSGSTLLAAILRQNPRFHAGMMSPVGGMYMALEGAMSRRNEAAIGIEEEQRRNVLKGLFANYYAGIHKEKLVFDTNRAWCTKLPALAQLFPKARVICCVRDISWIVDSIERLVRKNAFELSGMFGYEAGKTMFNRVTRMASGDGVVGYALDALKEAYYSEQSEKLILVEYEALAKHPEETLRHIYSNLSEPYYRHDFENVEYAAEDFDTALGTRGLHTVRRKVEWVEWVERESVLPPELFHRFVNDTFWRVPGVTF